MPAEGGDPVALVSVPEAAYALESHPTGAKLPLPTRKAAQSLCRNWAWWLLAGGAMHFVARSPLGGRRLAWAPSGKALQYRLTRNGASNIWEQPLTGGPPQQLTKYASGLIFDFAWSRDGKQLFLTKGNQTSDVILISNFK